MHFGVEEKFGKQSQKSSNFSVSSVELFNGKVQYSFVINSFVPKISFKFQFSEESDVSSNNERPALCTF